MHPGRSPSGALPTPASIAVEEQFSCCAHALSYCIRRLPSCPPRSAGGVLAANCAVADMGLSRSLSLPGVTPLPRYLQIRTPCEGMLVAVPSHYWGSASGQASRFAEPQAGLVQGRGLGSDAAIWVGPVHYRRLQTRPEIDAAVLDTAIAVGRWSCLGKKPCRPQLERLLCSQRLVAIGRRFRTRL